MGKFCLFILLIAIRCLAFASNVSTPVPFVLPNTEVQELHATNLNRDYQLYVALPKSYGSGRQSYPVVFVTDAPYAFPVAASIGAFVARHSKDLPEFILIGLSYAKGDTAEFSRRRDYTPSQIVGGSFVGNRLTSDMPGRAPIFGEAEGYRRFLADEVFPFVASHYRADMTHKILAGHSYGSLFGAYVMLTDPAMFDGYVLGSPSLWYDDHLLFAREREFAATHKRLAARVYIGVGSFEAIAPKNRPHDTRYNTEGDMVADATAFAHALSSHHYADLHLRSEIIPEENHLTVAPILLTRGLLWTLGGIRQ